MTQRQLIVADRNHKGQCILPVVQSIDVPALASTDWLDDDRLVLRAAGGDGVTLLLDDKAHVHAVGGNYFGQLGRGHANIYDPDNRIPRPVAGIGNVRIVQIAAGNRHCAAVTESGQLFTWHAGWRRAGPSAAAAGRAGGYHYLCARWRL